jgi:hypothetical protein
MGVTLSATRLPFLQVLSSPFKDLRTLSGCLDSLFHRRANRGNGLAAAMRIATLLRVLLRTER